jgi:hypoxanthine-guanine phosphoribosyltransferase
MEGNLCAIGGGRMVAFSAVGAEPERGRDILQVDDVFTNGTIISGCAWVLCRAAAARVYAAAVARPLKTDRIGIQREAREAA